MRSWGSVHTAQSAIARWDARARWAAFTQLRAREGTAIATRHLLHVDAAREHVCVAKARPKH
eukprot:18754-Pleurochrysis_carterae.AAC.1